MNGITLNQLGYWAICNVFYGQLVDEIRNPWKISVDAKDLKEISEGVELSGISTEKDSINFEITEQSFPTLLPPGNVTLPSQLEVMRDQLKVTNLDAGEYTLSVDGIDIVTASHDQWATGIAVDTSPSHRESEVLREAINDKNLQFTYGWKALNQVHIVGERKHSPSGQALPEELIKFYQLAEDRESALSKYKISLPKKRQWRLAPAKKD